MRTTLIWVLLASAPAWAELEAKLVASDTELGTEDVLEVTVEYSDPPPGVSIEWPSTPDFERGGASSSTSRFTKDTRVVGETRSFRPTREGTLTFPAAIVKSPLGTTAKTEPVTVTVIKGHVSTAKRAKPDVKRSTAPVTASDGLFLRAELEPADATLGDPLDLKLELFVRDDVVLSEIDQIDVALPSDVAIEELAVKSRREQAIGGKTYRVFELRAARVLPLSIGSFTVTPSVRVTVGRDAALLTANPLSVEVKPASDARRAFTKEEAVALLERKASVRQRFSPEMLLRRGRPVSPIKNVKFKP